MGDAPDLRPDALAEVLARWTDHLAPATRNQLSAYDLQALYDRLSRARTEGPERLHASVMRWARQLGPTTRDTLSAYDIAALCQAMQGAEPAPPRRRASAVTVDPDPAPPKPSPPPAPLPDPTSLGPPSRPEHARLGGFTGDTCTVCGSMALVRSGTCATCQACGATTGCS
ncbi:MAG: hypothetical protein KTR31_19355 [Myxococcales bacterium]|nr:hypothetical protein [Myxococcales bacterium]